MRRAWALAAIACAGCAAAGPRPCAPGGHASSDERLVGEGAASTSDDDPASLARQRALASLAQQIQVEVVAAVRVDERYSAGGSDSRSALEVESHLEARSALALAGAEVVSSCTDARGARVALGLDRVRFARAGRDRIAALSAELAALAQQADEAAQRGEKLAAIGALQLAEQRAAEAELVALEVAAVGRAGAPRAEPSSSFRRRAQELQSRFRLAIIVAPDHGTGEVLQAARACLGKAGLPVADGADADATLVVEVSVGQATQLGESLYLARGVANAVLRRRHGAAVAGGQGAVKAGGLTAEAARRDVPRQIAEQALPRLVDQVLSQLGWPGLRRCSEPLR